MIEMVAMHENAKSGDLLAVFTHPMHEAGSPSTVKMVKIIAATIIIAWPALSISPLLLFSNKKKSDLLVSQSKVQPMVLRAKNPYCNCYLL